MKLFILFSCLLGKHKRSRGQAWQDGDVFRTTCRGCGKPMIRAQSGWRLDDGDAPAAKG